MWATRQEFTILGGQGESKLSNCFQIEVILACKCQRREEAADRQRSGAGRRQEKGIHADWGCRWVTWGCPGAQRCCSDDVAAAPCETSETLQQGRETDKAAPSISFSPLQKWTASPWTEHGAEEMVFLKQERENPSDHFLTSVLLPDAKLTKRCIREQIIKSLNTIVVRFKISVLIIFAFDKVIILQETAIGTIFAAKSENRKVGKVLLHERTRSKLNSM